MLFDETEKKNMPKLNIPGVDEAKAQSKYINAMFNYFFKKPVLFSIFNDYEYNNEEKSLKVLLKESRQVFTKITRTQFGAHVKKR